MWGTLLALTFVTFIRLTVPPVTEWDHSNGHHYVMGRSYPSVGRMLVILARDAVTICFLPVISYVGVALVSAVRRQPVVVPFLLWRLWILSILGWLLLGDWWSMSD
jgi:hypothetical protein